MARVRPMAVQFIANPVHLILSRIEIGWCARRAFGTALEGSNIVKYLEWRKHCYFSRRNPRSPEAI